MPIYNPAPSSRLSSIILTITRDLADVSGDVGYPGAGFIPTAIIALGSINNQVASWGVGGESRDAGTVFAHEYNTFTNFGQLGAVILSAQIDAAKYQTAVLKSYDADGFTLTWTKFSTPTGIFVAHALCLR
ncbi:hypothetical protein ES703_84674 [subsurface metagenome]